MSEDNEADTCCASCGSAEVDDIKLKECADCKSVKYCSDTCQKNHKSQHEEACKKRVVELRDELLFKQPENSHLGDCPICMIPLQLDQSKSSLYSCCSKIICGGCDRANDSREEMASLEPKCPFCRTPVPTKNELDKRRMKRIEVNDPVAMRQWGVQQYKKGDYSTAFEYFARAAELGNAEAHYRLSQMYDLGNGIEKDGGKEMYHLEEAAIGGHPNARFNLGCIEWNNDNKERAVKHWIIAAAQGDDKSIKYLMNAYKGGFVSKENLAAALRAQKAAVDETKSPQREAAEKAFAS
ncbi:Sel1-like repeat family protein [Skeletonema marinoi]|uniref:Sel1-like repeat family protein n=1 Tax=Skeletonema marinoi TaxID=267567 RepID=A0AAD8XU43_9STRA|nr:Sel1-like repeat family protein [Skeletonema marinoi]